MSKLMQIVEKDIQNQGQMERRLIAISKKYPGAWVPSIIPFSTEVHFLQFRSPSKIPDRYMDSHIPGVEIKIGYEGKLVPFSKAAKLREQNRGVGGDR